MTNDKMQELLKRSVAGFRYVHAMGVAETAADLASRFNADQEKAWVAGLLHDCAKGMDDDSADILALANEAGITPTETQMTNPKLFLHAPVSAYLAKRDYQVDDPEILNAIRLHQTGDLTMTQLDKIIYVSDWIEPNRKDTDRFREIARTDLNEAFFRIYGYSIKEVIEKGWNFFDGVSDIYNSLWIKRKRKGRRDIDESIDGRILKKV